jgi:hypothetical protein
VPVKNQLKFYLPSRNCPYKFRKAMRGLAHRLVKTWLGDPQRWQAGSVVLDVKELVSLRGLNLLKGVGSQVGPPRFCFVYLFLEIETLKAICDLDPVSSTTGTV